MHPHKIPICGKTVSVTQTTCDDHVIASPVCTHCPEPPPAYPPPAPDDLGADDGE